MHCPPSTHCHGHTSPAVFGAVAAAAANTTSSSSDSTEPSCSPWFSLCGYLRYLVVFLGFLGYTIDYMLRFNLSVAIVAMVNNSVTVDINSSYACPAALNASVKAQSTTGAGEYNWTAQEQGLALGTIFWGFVITKVTGGRIAEVLGPTFTVTITLGMGAILTLLTPTVAAVHPLALAALRFLLGMMQGPMSPAIISIISRWAPAGEIATMICIVNSGLGLGTLLSLGLSGLVIKAYGWRWVFWGSGILSLAWLPLWIMYVRDDPREHPGMSKSELRLLSKNHNKPRRRVPWSRIFKSRHVYLLTMMEFLTAWIQGVLLTEGPTFMTEQVGIDLQTAGTVNIVVMTIAVVFAIFYGWLSDLFERKEWMPMVTVRRIAQGFGMVMTMGSMVGLALAGCDAVLVVMFIIIAVVGVPIFMVTYSVAPMVIAPNYAGTISGLIGAGDVAGFLLPMFVSFFMDKENGWATIFLITGAINIVASVIFIIGMPAGEVEWNMYEEIPGGDKPSTSANNTTEITAGDKRNTQKRNYERMGNC